MALIAAAALAAGDCKPEITLSKAKDDDNAHVTEPTSSVYPTKPNNNKASKVDSNSHTQSLSLTPPQDSLTFNALGRKSAEKHHFRRHSSGSFMGQ